MLGLLLRNDLGPAGNLQSLRGGEIEPGRSRTAELDIVQRSERLSPKRRLPGGILARVSR